jgi:hypothetical protein
MVVDDSHLGNARSLTVKTVNWMAPTVKYSYSVPKAANQTSHIVRLDSHTIRETRTAAHCDVLSNSLTKQMSWLRFRWTKINLALSH